MNIKEQSGLYKLVIIEIDEYDYASKIKEELELFIEEYLKEWEIRGCRLSDVMFEIAER